MPQPGSEINTNPVDENNTSKILTANLHGVITLKDNIFNTFKSSSSSSSSSSSIGSSNGGGCGCGGSSFLN